MLRVTSYKDWRINFKLNDLQYCLIDTGDSYEHGTELICETTGNSWFIAYKDFHDVISDFIKSEKHGKIYKDRYDIDKFEIFIEEIISGIPYQQTSNMKEQLIKYHLKEFEFHKQQLRELGYNVDKEI